jgi:hypothetical protein
VPFLKLLDARRYSARFRNDFDPPTAMRRHPRGSDGQASS